MKTETPDYDIVGDIEDMVPDYGLENLFDEGVLPDTEKQIVVKPPDYEESLKDVTKGKKQIYVGPKYFPEEMSPEYEEDEEIDYALEDEDRANYILDELGIRNYDDVEKQLSEPIMTPKNTKAYLRKILKDAKFRRNQLRGAKAQISYAYDQGKIYHANRDMEFKRIDDAKAILVGYIKYYEKKNLGGYKAQE